MVFLVPFDGSNTSKAALERAVEHGEAMNQDVVAISLVPTGSEYAIRRKWIHPDDDFATETARNELERKIDEATGESERNFDDPAASAPQDGIAERIRRVADEVDASVLFVGTSDPPRTDGVHTPFGSIAQDAEYDVHIVRSA